VTDVQKAVFAYLPNARTGKPPRPLGSDEAEQLVAVAPHCLNKYIRENN
jgi:hypothetical protein